jgi:hypothetical protein
VTRIVNNPPRGFDDQQVYFTGMIDFLHNLEK